MANQEVMAKMNAAADKAEQDLLQVIKKMTPEQKEGASQLTRWIKSNYMYAGYKRLSKIVLRHL